MKLGLLGALGGLGKGMQQFGSSLFDEQIQKEREARLQSIRDKEYARGRADTLADYQMQRADKVSDYQMQRNDQLTDQQTVRGFQLEDRDADQAFRKGVLAEERAYQSGQIQQIVKGDDGELVGINADGTRRDLGSVTVDDNVLNDYLRSFNSLNASLLAQGASPDMPEYAADFQLRASLMSAITQRLPTSLSAGQQAALEKARKENSGMSDDAILEELSKDSRFMNLR